MTEPTPRAGEGAGTRGQPILYLPLTPGRVMILTLSVLFVLGLVWFAIQIGSIILLLILGILLAAAIEPLVNRLRRRGFTRGQAILSVYGAIFAVLALFIVLGAPPLYLQGSQFVQDIPAYLDDLYQRAQQSDVEFIRTQGTRTIDRVREALANPEAALRIQATQVTQLLDVLTSVIGVLFTAVSVMIVAYYWMTEKALIKRLILGWVPLNRRDRAHALWDEIEAKLGGWARGQVVLMLVIGLVSTVAYAVLDLPFWYLLGIWAGFTELIPFIGPFLGGGLAALVALTESWQKALIVVGFVIVLQQLEGSVLVPRVMRNAVGLTPLTVILAVLIGGTLLGPLGAILAIPVAAAVQVVVQDLLRTRDVTFDSVSVSEALPAVGRERHGAGEAAAPAPSGAGTAAEG